MSLQSQHLVDRGLRTRRSSRSFLDSTSSLRSTEPRIRETLKEKFNHNGILSTNQKSPGEGNKSRRAGKVSVGRGALQWHEAPKQVRAVRAPDPLFYCPAKLRPTGLGAGGASEQKTQTEPSPVPDSGALLLFSWFYWVAEPSTQPSVPSKLTLPWLSAVQALPTSHCAAAYTLRANTPVSDMEGN